jgi:predicted Zn-ribbon and HTH transcriptional regulator
MYHAGVFHAEHHPTKGDKTVFTLSKSVLLQLLSVRISTPERLSEHETKIAARICHCTCCDYYWIRKTSKIPDRCPNCHRAAWDRPLLTAMAAADKSKSSAAQNQPDGERKANNP